MSDCDTCGHEPASIEHYKQCLTGVPQADGIYSTVAEDAYHQDRGSLSVSGAKLLLPPSCPEKFLHYMTHPRKPKKEWDFGHVAHALILGKGAEFVVLDPAEHGLNKDGSPSKSPTATAMWKDHVAEARKRQKVPIHIDEFHKAEAIADKVLNHSECGPWFSSGEAEMAAYTTDITGTRLRGRADWVTDDLIIDVKTAITANPAALEKRFWDLGYHLQDAWYRDLFKAATGADLRFKFVVVEKEPPHVVQVVDYDAEALAEARRLNRQAIDLYTSCMESKTWPAYADTTVTLSAPYYALKARDNAIYNEAAALERNWDDFFSTSNDN